MRIRNILLHHRRQLKIDLKQEAIINMHLKFFK